MLRPDVRKLLNRLPLNTVIEELENFIRENPKKEFYLANIDLLRLYGKSLDSGRFYKLALFLKSKIKNSLIDREISRYAYFIEKDCLLAKDFARNAIKINKNEPLWVYYVARLPHNYYEKLYDGIYLTAIPKNASTSLKAMILEGVYKEKNRNPHSVFGNPFFSTNDLYEEINENDIKLISIREPVSRFLSYYNKNIIEESSLHEELLYTKKNEEFGLPLKPTLDYFIDNLNLYCYMFNDVLHHVLPQTAYFSDLSNYSCIADLSESYKLEDLISKKLDLQVPIHLPKKMVSKNPVKELLITEDMKMKIEKLFKDDINILTERRRENIEYSFRF